MNRLEAASRYTWDSVAGQNKALAMLNGRSIKEGKVHCTSNFLRIMQDQGLVRRWVTEDTGQSKARLPFGAAFQAIFCQAKKHTSLLPKSDLGTALQSRWGLFLAISGLARDLVETFSTVFVVANVPANVHVSKNYLGDSAGD
jgi:hypothetical protein